MSGADLKYRDPETNEEFWPFVVEPTVGLDRLMLVVLLDAYMEYPNGRSGEGEMETVLHLDKKLAPVKVAVLPLSKKEELSSVARTIAADLRKHVATDYDETQSIGKRYRRQDEIGTPYCVTVDFETLNDHKVTIRDRDTMKQDRVAISELAGYITEALK
jgi:glycyl-tRNA synthetase